ncbi:MFS transporter [Mycobacterium sp. 21AC1]|uniref:MFS transporter n=1 Tax=[Mycobacterium] appelbergii TaxID=2939269 RepID=UPI002938E36F|nr:MFS transporter [Mycobacterium sp. 21AC1]MDV3125822.1 MFS transporter [Mycobacterium sp. 21AC1]
MTGRPGRPALALLLVHAIFVQIISYALRPAISYAILDLGHGPAWLGVATAAFAVPPLLLAVPAGRFVDRVGERASMVLGALAFVGAGLVAVFVGATLAGLLAATILLGLGVLCSVVAEQAWVMRDAPPGRLDFAFGLYTFATSTGQMAGPGLLLLPSANAASPAFGTIAWTTLGIAVAGLALSLAIPSTVQTQVTDTKPAAMWPVASRLLRTNGVKSALVTSSVVLSSLDIVLAYLPLLARERELAPVWLTALLVTRGVATMASRLTLGSMTGRFGRRRVLIVAGAVAAASLIALVLPLPAFALVGCMALYGLAAGTVQPLTMSWMTLVTPRQDRGVAASLRLVGNRAGQTGIPLAVAGMSVVGGAGLVFAATGASLVAAAWLSRWAPDDQR